MDGVRRYTGPAIAFHWLVAAGVIANVLLAWTWPYLGDTGVRTAINTHKSIGITVLGLAIMRLLWRWSHRPPAMPSTYQRWEAALAHATHWALYGIIFAMPISGWVMDSAWKDADTHPMFLFGLFQWPRIAAIQHLDPATRDAVHAAAGQAHSTIAWVVYGLLALHLAGTAKHQWLDREPEVQRMLPGA